MPGRRLQWCWRCLLAAYFLTLGVVALTRVAAEQTALLRFVVVCVLVVGGLGVLFWLRPRPFQRVGDGREEAETLRALLRGRFTGTTAQRLAAIDVARRTLFGLLPQVLLWSMIAVTNLDGRRVGDWIAVVAVIGLVGCAVGLVLARWCMSQLDGWEKRLPAQDSSSSTVEGA